MKIEQWNEEPFLRDLEIENQIILVTKAIHDYLDYRNIEQDKTQKLKLIKFVLEGLKRFPLAKTSFIIWSLEKFADKSNSNISAFMVMGAIEEGYKNDLYKSFIKQYLTTKQNSMVEQESESSKSERNRIARKESFDKISEMVNSGKTDYEHVLWLNCMNYIGNDLKYAPDQSIIDRFQTLAIKHITKDLKVIQADDNTKRDEKTKVFTYLAEIYNNQIEQPELISMIKLQRRKMVCEDYIFNN